ncbi:extracellular solute-binding protein [Streptomyces chartreusis]|uniref:extracellular solute-binding protein n=1 Tax=Streptomyces chartreusis TaxID=1969 RepID=UPI0033A99875
MLPALLLFAFVVLVPSGRGVYYAFTDWDGLSRDFSFVGLGNFSDMLGDADARQVVWHALLIAVAITVVQNAVGLALALGVNSAIKSRNLLRVFLFAPAVVTPIVTAYLWRNLLGPDGAVNSLLGAVGLDSWEQDQQLAATGKTLGIVQGNWVIALLKGKNPKGTFTFKALPATDDPSATLMPAAAGAGYGVNAKAKSEELALKFVNFVMSPEGMNLFVKKQGSLPSLPDTGHQVDRSLAELSTFIQKDRTVPFMDQLWPNAKVQQTMLSGLQEIFSGQSTPRELLRDMDAEYKAGS